MRILLVSQMYPSQEDPDFGAFVALIERELVALGHVIERVAITGRSGGYGKHAALYAKATRRARSFKPDVVYGHFLFPAGASASRAAYIADVPLVMTAHGTDVENAEKSPGLRFATGRLLSECAAVIAVSEHLAGRLDAIARCADRTSVINCGVDTQRFAPADPVAARAALGWEGDGPFVVCVGSLTARKNVVGLADAFARLGRGQLAFVGDGPLRRKLEGRERVRMVGRVEHQDVATWLAAADVIAQPSQLEPFGQVALEAMAVGRPVLATKNGGPPEFVPSGAGVLIDPVTSDAIYAGLQQALALSSPNQVGIDAAQAHSADRQARRIADVLERVLDDYEPRRN